jgi:hypothetical protein
LGADEGKPWRAGFSLNIPPEEGVLTRVPVEPLEELLGSGSVLTVERGRTLRDLFQGRWHSSVVELFPWLMILVLLALAVENLFANKFYRRRTGSEGGTSGERKVPIHAEDRMSKMEVKS